MRRRPNCRVPQVCGDGRLPILRLVCSIWPTTGQGPLAVHTTAYTLRQADGSGGGGHSQNVHTSIVECKCFSKGNGSKSLRSALNGARSTKFLKQANKAKNNNSKLKVKSNYVFASFACFRNLVLRAPFSALRKDLLPSLLHANTIVYLSWRTTQFCFIERNLERNAHQRVYASGVDGLAYEMGQGQISGHG
jgi:hypothetical protein